MVISRSTRCAAAIITGVLLITGSITRAADWPQWRGADATGISLQRNAPVQWSDRVNVTWQRPLGGGAISQPIVWGDRVFVTGVLRDQSPEAKSATDDAHPPEDHASGGGGVALLCFDRRTGTLLWRDAVDGPATELDASATPATDGKLVYARLGSAGIVAVDFDGKQIWHYPLDDAAAAAREGKSPGRRASPILWHDMLIVHDGAAKQPSVIALDKRTGRMIWRHVVINTNSAGRSSATPVVIGDSDDINAQPQLIVPLSGRLAGLNPMSGRVYWHCDGIGPEVDLSPIVGLHAIAAAGGPADATSPTTMIGIRIPGADGSGDITATHRRWRLTGDDVGAGDGEGVIIAERVYSVDAAGVMRCIDAVNGRVIWRHKLGDDTGAGAITYIAGKLYIVDRHAVTSIVRPGDAFDLVATNKLGDGETTTAPPAFSDGQIFIRTNQHLYCIGVRLR